MSRTKWIMCGPVACAAPCCTRVPPVGPTAGRLVAPASGTVPSAVLSRLYPLRGLPNQGQLWSWISFDVANQSFTLLINTLLFSIFFQQVVVRDPAIDDWLWSIVYAASMMLVVIASPIAGAIVDARACKKLGLLLSGFACAALTCALGLIPPGQFWIAVLIYVPANFAFNIGENFLGAFLPQLARREDFGRVSGFSWGVAYAAALVMLVLTALAMLVLDLKDSEQWRPFFVGAGLWFFAFSIPTLLFLREGSIAADPGGSLLTVGFKRLARTTREVGRFRDLGMLLLASFFYGGGISVIVAFASILAVEFGFSQVELVVYVAVITVTGILGTLIPTFYQDRFGHKKMTIMLLIAWVLTALYIAWISYQHANAPPNVPEPTWPVWLAGNLLGLGLGAFGSANRAFVGFLTPPNRSGEFFGLWGLVFKLAAVLVIPFGYVKDAWGTWQAMIVLAGMLLIGLILTALIDEKRGEAAAKEANG